MAKTQEDLDREKKAKGTGKFVWVILTIITIMVGIASLWYFSQLMIDEGINTISSIGNEFMSWS